MKRFFTQRYPLGHDENNSVGGITIKVAVVVSFLTGMLTYKTWKRTEEKRKSVEQGYHKLDPDSVVPRAEDIVPVNHEKLKRAVLEGNEFFLEELGIKIISSPEEYVYYRTEGVSNKEAFLKYVREEIKKLPQFKP